MKQLQDKIHGLVYIFLGLMESTTNHLLEMEELQDLKTQNISEIIVEFMFFNLHQFSRLLFAWFGEKERNIIMDGMIFELHKFLAKENIDNLEKVYDHLTIKTLQNYIDDLSFKALLNDFINVYNGGFNSQA